VSPLIQTPSPVSHRAAKQDAPYSVVCISDSDDD
jgi:hypothetical protein